MNLRYTLAIVWPAPPDDDAERQGFYVLRGGHNWASVEGHAAEWLAIAAWIRKPVGRYCDFKRCGVYPRDNGGFYFMSPRNSTSDTDGVPMTRDEGLAFAEHIVAALREHKEPCVGDFTPLDLRA